MRQFQYTQKTQPTLVRTIFSIISPKYDLLNHILSFGCDIRWRKRALSYLPSGCLFLDVATGTGDMALAIAQTHKKAAVIGIDFSPSMLQIAKKKGKSLQDRVTFQEGDATNLPFSDNTFDAAVIAFGIRNIPDKKKALQEMQRVVVPKGIVIIIEMVSQQNRLLQRLYQTYLLHGLPWIAGLISRQPKAYQYLSSSILHFPSVKEFWTILHQSGLVPQKTIAMTGGITRLFISCKPPSEESSTEF